MPLVGPKPKAKADEMLSPEGFLHDVPYDERAKCSAPSGFARGRMSTVSRSSNGRSARSCCDVRC